MVPNDIDKCHRLSNVDNVIIEFKEREKRDDMLRNRKNLKTKAKELVTLGCSKTMILESLTPVYALLDFFMSKAPKLMKDKHIFETWFFNGRLWIVPDEGGRK